MFSNGQLLTVCVDYARQEQFKGSWYMRKLPGYAHGRSVHMCSSCKLQKELACLLLLHVAVLLFCFQTMRPDN